MSQAVNITDIKNNNYEMVTSNSNCTGGPVTKSSSYPVCPSEIYLRSRPASTSQGWTEVKGVRWRPPTAWKHESVLIKFHGAGFRYGVERKTSSYCTRRALQVPPTYTDLPVSAALFRGGTSLARFRIGAESSSLVSRAEVKALEKLKLADAELGETFAQWRQTARLVTDNTNRIRRSWKIFSKKNPKAAKQIRQGCFGCSASQLWLELVYGWIPLLQDIYSSIQVLSDVTSQQGMVVRVRGSATDVTSELSTIARIHSGTPGFSVPAGKEITLTTNHRVGVILWYKLENAQLRSFNSLGLINPASLRWNLIPYSFILDWLLPIGPWLASFSADAGFEFLTGTKSYKREVRQLIPTARPIEPVQSTKLFGPDKTGGYVSVEANYFRRTVYQSRPVPGLYFKNPLSPIHVLNALALLRQAFK